MTTSTLQLGPLIMDYLEQASYCSVDAPEKGLGVTRLYLSKQHKDVINLVTAWMENAGMTTRLDHTGTVLGMYPGGDPDSKTLILGSHVDTVKNGGKYDGMLGVIVPIVCIKKLHEQGIKLPYSVMVAAFGDEEGTRFQDSMIGSGALAGDFDPSSLRRVDDNGISMKQAMLEFGLNPENISECALDPDSLLGYVEIHIEQGPILENHDQPVGVITAITGLERHIIEFSGESGHAGTVPMHNRKDALVAASKAVVAIDDYLQATDELVGVIGEISISPGSVNVIPDKVKLSLEFRSPKRGIRDSARGHFLQILDSIEKQSGVTFKNTQTYSSQSTPCDDSLTALLAESIKRFGYKPLRLFSGAGHDGQAMAGITDIAMLFVRCQNGLSHHPDESIREQDADIAARVLLEFLLTFGSPST